MHTPLRPPCPLLRRSPLRPLSPFGFVRAFLLHFTRGDVDGGGRMMGRRRARRISFDRCRRVALLLCLHELTLPPATATARAGKGTVTSTPHHVSPSALEPWTILCDCAWSRFLDSLDFSMTLLFQRAF
jgi:hypothetical protein